MDLGSGAGCFLRAAIIPQGLVETDDKPRQGRGVAERVQGREPGHASLAIVALPLPSRTRSREWARSSRCCPRPKQGRHRRFPSWTRCQARRNCRGIAPPPRWRSRTGSPSSSRLNCSCWPPSGRRSWRSRSPSRRMTWVAVTEAGLERAEGRRRRATHGWRDRPRRGHLAREKTKMVSEPWLLTRTSKSPLGLATTSIALGSAGVSPFGSSSDATLKPLP